MTKSIYAAIVAVVLAGAPFAAYADGPRPSSYDNWSEMMQATTPAAVPAISPFDGPRPSSLNNWPGTVGAVSNAALPATAGVQEGPRPSGH